MIFTSSYPNLLAKIKPHTKVITKPKPTAWAHAKAFN